MLRSCSSRQGEAYGATSSRKQVVVFEALARGRLTMPPVAVIDQTVEHFSVEEARLTGRASVAKCEPA
jgi:hypothetical protein